MKHNYAINSDITDLVSPACLYKDLGCEDIIFNGFNIIILEEMENPTLSPEAIAFAARMYDAARAGQLDVFEQALPAGLPANMTNEKGDSLVSLPGTLT
jgi:hypothetical protein